VALRPFDSLVVKGSHIATAESFSERALNADDAVSHLCNGFAEKCAALIGNACISNFQLSEQNEMVSLFVTRHSNQPNDSLGQ
jgi:hypothetical protein